jgi:hypothetical protein
MRHKQVFIGQNYDSLLEFCQSIDLQLELVKGIQAHYRQYLQR